MERLSILYASALFDLALEADAVDMFLDQAILLRDSLQEDDCRRVIVHPHISAIQKQEFFRNTFSGQIHENLLGFLYLVTDKNRETYLLPALESLIGMILKHKNIVTGIVYFATAIDDRQAATMKETLSEKLGKQVDISLKVDPSIIGGPYVYVDGYYMDWTVKRRLRDLAVHMKEGCSV